MIGGRVGWYVTSYFLGSVPTGYWLGVAWKGVDVRKQGSGNLGATNVFRVLGPAAGATTLGIDILKGFFTVFGAHVLFPGDLHAAMIAGLCAILGHTTSIFVRFKGGKGVATSAGVFLALLPIPSVAALASFIIVFGLTRYVSLGSMTGAAVLALTSFVFSPAWPLEAMATGVALFIVWTHRANIQRLRAGTENRIEWKKAANV